MAGQVAGSSISTSPLPYGAMASQCEALGMGTRKKLSSWLGNGHESIPEKPTIIGKVSKQTNRQTNILPLSESEDLTYIHGLQISADELGEVKAGKLCSVRTMGGFEAASGESL